MVWLQTDSGGKLPGQKSGDFWFPLLSFPSLFTNKVVVIIECMLWISKIWQCWATSTLGGMHGSLQRREVQTNQNLLDPLRLSGTKTLGLSTRKCKVSFQNAHLDKSHLLFWESSWELKTNWIMNWDHFRLKLKPFLEESDRSACDFITVFYYIIGYLPVSPVVQVFSSRVLCGALCIHYWVYSPALLNMYFKGLSKVG